MTAFTTAAECSTDSISFDAVMQVMAEFERRWPASERCQSIGVRPDKLLRLYAELPTVTVRGKPLDGMGVYERQDIPSDSWLADMADGSSVLNYAGGRTVRCLASREAEK